MKSIPSLSWERILQKCVLQSTQLRKTAISQTVKWGKRLAKSLNIYIKQIIELFNRQLYV